MVRKKEHTRLPDRCACWEKKVCRESIEAEAAVADYGQKVPIHSLQAYPCRGEHGCWHTGHGMTPSQRQERREIMNWWRFA